MKLGPLRLDAEARFTETINRVGLHLRAALLGLPQVYVYLERGLLLLPAAVCINCLPIDAEQGIVLAFDDFGP